MSEDEFDHLLDDEPVTETPQAGETYRGLPVAAGVRWQHPKHELWAHKRAAKGLAAPFYVALPSGALAWVPWPGSALVSQDDRAWVMDLLREDAETDQRPEGKKR